MPDYKAAQVAGSKWQRCHRLTIENTFETTPRVIFEEEVIVNMGAGELVSKPVNSIVEEFAPDKYTTQFDVLNPITGEAIGTAQYQDVYGLLHSLYIHLAQDRDAAEQLAAEQLAAEEPVL